MGRSTPIENIGVSAAPPKPSGPPDPEKEIAARLGEAGGEDYERTQASNLPQKEYALARLDAIANLVDPHLADLDALDALIWLADAVMFGEALA
ncbi:hypothetical protein LG047_07175 [Methylocystis sp. WRRC1]|uniref:hypothetical protein n=1 Tax=Methylocystis sp. WRRC1 TaxID=1732014 RepID=UPI001D144061|nr:hypothetical protein [Methylocystis sp. WRRC1]MCC3245099.1 hypothetical protein [Methylocystis sp. WRRC1]